MRRITSRTKPRRPEPESNSLMTPSPASAAAPTREGSCPANPARLMPRGSTVQPRLQLAALSGVPVAATPRRRDEPDASSSSGSELVRGARRATSAGLRERAGATPKRRSRRLVGDRKTSRNLDLFRLLDDIRRPTCVNRRRGARRKPPARVASAPGSAAVAVRRGVAMTRAPLADRAARTVPPRGAILLVSRRDPDAGDGGPSSAPRDSSPRRTLRHPGPGRNAASRIWEAGCVVRTLRSRHCASRVSDASPGLGHRRTGSAPRPAHRPPRCPRRRSRYALPSRS